MFWRNEELAELLAQRMLDAAKKQQDPPDRGDRPQTAAARFDAALNRTRKAFARRRYFSP
jgi:hypothetical protein